MSVIPPNTDDLTLWTDPVTQWALRALAAWAGAVVCVAISLIP
ncbi:hypothetical protein SEA_DEJAVU_117 [Microbacterium Phage DejaVu]|nr:hypothetical protein SEA_DEJAVU_1 [Microbacterium Phage DejaVu]WNM66249.1 hypothetical protein SEA_DEJAVU_117 [Microbacterium Phage DejaVu]